MSTLPRACPLAAAAAAWNSLATAAEQSISQLVTAQERSRKAARETMMADDANTSEVDYLQILLSTPPSLAGEEPALADALLLTPAIRRPSPRGGPTAWITARTGGWPPGVGYP